MKLSFTIRHWPGMDWGQFCAAAADSRLAGLEIDSVYNPVLSQRMSPVNPELAVAARRELVRQGLEVPCVGVEADLTAEEAPAETAAALEAAANLLVPYVVVHTASSDSASPIRKAYRRRNRPKKSGSPHRPSTAISQPARRASCLTCRSLRR